MLNILEVLRRRLVPSPCRLLRDAAWREEKARCLELPRASFPWRGMRRPVVRCPHCGAKLGMSWGREDCQVLRGQGDCPRCAYWTTVRIVAHADGVYDMSYPAEDIKRYALPPPGWFCDRFERI